MSGADSAGTGGEGALLAAQSALLAPFRDRLLRRAYAGTRCWTLDLAAGHGALAAELAARVRGPVVALDIDRSALKDAAHGPLRVQADAHALPFTEGAFDLVVVQLAWLWLRDPDAAAREVHRVLAPGGVLACVAEPDCGAAMEEPAASALAPLWESVLGRLGADARMGRRLPGVLRAAGFARVEAEVFGQLAAAHDVPEIRRAESARLASLGLDDDETLRLRDAVGAAVSAGPRALAFVPHVGALAWKGIATTTMTP